MSKKTNTAKIDNAVAKGVSYEVTIADRARAVSVVPGSWRCRRW